MTNKESNFVSVIVYNHKEDTRIGSFLSELYQFFSENFKQYEFICVNDAKEANDIREFKKKHPDVMISMVHMGFQHGVEASMNAGIDLSIGDFVFEFDSSYMDYKKTLIMDVYRKALEGYDIVAAVPPVEKSKMISKMFYRIYNCFSETENDLMTERFRIISRRAVNRVSAYGKTIPYRKAVYNSSGLKVGNIKYEPEKKIEGFNYVDVKRRNTALDALVIFTNGAYKLSLFLSVAMAIFMVISGVYTGISYLGHNKPVEGWAPIMGLVSVAFFAIFILLTIIIKYMDILLKLIFQKQKYFVSSVEKL